MIHGNNNRKHTSGRKHYCKPTLTVIGASIVPYNPAQRLHEISQIKDLKTRNAQQLRLSYTEFERSKRLANESAKDHYVRDISDFETLMGSKLKKAEYKTECYIKLDVIKSSKKINYN